MAKVRYVQGKKASYLALGSYDPLALYFCTDTKELYKGADLYSDGLRLVASYSSLPAFSAAADGIIYFCEDNGCGYVLNSLRTAWIPVIYGVDNETIGLNANGMMAVKAVPISSVTGLTEQLTAVDQKIIGVEDRVAAVEQMAVGGVHYKGAVETVGALPSDAEQGDLYEVREDNSEWCFNGEKWFEYGKTTITDISHLAEKAEVRRIAKLVDYEVSNKPVGTLVNYSDDEVRVMCPANTAWTLQNSGENANPNLYYIGFRAYAPSDDVVSFKEDLAQVISDQTMYYFENNEFAGVDEWGRKYSIVWLPVASYDGSAWTYYGATSTSDKLIGWDYSVEWYNTAGVKVAADCIRVNLSNEDCHFTAASHEILAIQNTVATLEEACTWSDM